MSKLKFLCLLTLVAPLIGCNNKSSGIIDVASYVDTSGHSDCSDKIQELINNNPNRTLYFRDGTYLLDHQILTPGDPTKSVDLQLSNYAILKASDNYQVKRGGVLEKWQDEYLYMVSLGGLDRINEVTIPGSVYSLTGGIIDGSGKAAGIEIAGGRETRVQNVSMKGVEIGLRIAPGVNGGGSSDADIQDMSIICNDSATSYGLKLEGSDNSATNIRIGHVTHGVLSSGGTNILKNVHPLHNGDCKKYNYDESVGFEISSFTELSNCYSDNFRIGYQFNNTSAFLTDCIAWWFGPAGAQGDEYAISSIGGELSKEFNATINNFVVGVKEIDKDVPRINPQIMIGAPTGGDGTIHNIRARNRELIHDIKKDGGTYIPRENYILAKYYEENIGSY
ncbi:MAG: hypothetical protein MJ214_00820 [Bacilli bacterium]|nr:hypothetical protein [Bacilli bacterium]